MARKTDNNDEVIFNDLTDQPMYGGFYLSEIIICVIISLTIFSLVFGLSLLEFKAFGLIGLYLLLFFKDDNKNSIIKKLIDEANYWIIEKKIYTRGDEYEKKERQ